MDLENEKLSAEVKVGAAQGVAVNERNGTYAVGTEAEQKVWIIDGKSASAVAGIKVDGSSRCRRDRSKARFDLCG